MEAMKNIILYQATMALLTILVASGCVKEDSFTHEPGSPVTFGASAAWQSDYLTRTEYSQEIVSGIERINWVPGTDRIVIYSPQAEDLQGNDTADYTIVAKSNTNQTGQATSEAGLSPTNQNGLRWGNDNIHYFHAFYPAAGMEAQYDFGSTTENVVQTTNATLTGITDSNDATVTGFIPSTQKWHKEGRVYKANMNYAYMYDVARITGGSGNVVLSLKPLVTAFEFTLVSRDLTNSNLIRVTLSSAQTNGSYLAGNFSTTISNSGSGGSYDSQNIALSNGTNTITVDIPSADQLTLDSSNPVKFTFLTLPVPQDKVTLILEFANGWKRSLPLKNSDLVTTTNPEGWITVAATKKLFVSNLSVPGINEYTLEVAGPTSHIPKAGGNSNKKNYRIKSYKKTTGASGYVYTPMSWTAEFSEDGVNWSATKPSWITTFTLSGPGSSNSNFVSFDVVAAENNTTTGWKGSTTSVGTSSAPRDLSCYDIYGNRWTGGTERSTPYNTSNCYVVSAPGWYCVPCVYGNAIQKGSAKSATYTGSATGTSSFILNGGFLNHGGYKISNAWIESNKVSTASNAANISIGAAALVWEDVSGLITNVSVKSFNNQKYVVFKVNATAQGNAVVAAKTASNGDIVWSWHIWVVDNPATNLATKTVACDIPTPASGVTSNDMLVRNLGVVEQGIQTRSVTVRVTQAVTGNQEEFIITQEGELDQRVTYYQWGRKDPMRPGHVQNTVNSPAEMDMYDANGLITWPTAVAGDTYGTIPYSIKNPMTFIKQITANETNGKNNNNWLNTRYDNLWNTNVKTNVPDGPDEGNSNNATSYDQYVQKTIYDPSPQGFKLPNRNAYTAFADHTKISYFLFVDRRSSLDQNGNQVAGQPDYLDGLNIALPIEFTTIRGMNFYTDATRTETIFFRSSGSRPSTTGNVSGILYYGDHSTATPASQYRTATSQNATLAYFTFGKGSNATYGYGYYVGPIRVHNRGYGFPTRPVRDPDQY